MDISNLLDSIYQLDCVDRWAGLYVTQRESVAQHSYHVACIAGLLVMIENNVFGKNIDIKTVLLSALLHDIGDCKLTHITYEVRNLSTEFYNAVHNSKIELWNSIVHSESNDALSDKWLEQVLYIDETIKYLIESADVIDAMCFAKREVKRNNAGFVPILDRQKKLFQELKKKYNCLSYFETYYLE